jgi:hypothetical protein
LERAPTNLPGLMKKSIGSTHRNATDYKIMRKRKQLELAF